MTRGERGTIDEGVRFDEGLKFDKGVRFDEEENFEDIVDSVLCGY